MSGKTIIIGIGNRYRGDDSLGRIIARSINERAGLKVLEHNGEMASLIDSWQGYDKVILADTVMSGNPAGTIISLNLHQTTLPDNFKLTSTHGFGVAEAVELARVLHQLPKEIFFYGIEGANFALGEKVSPPLQKNIAQLVEQIMECANA